MDDAFKYIIKNNGIDTEQSYPYQAHVSCAVFSMSSSNLVYSQGLLMRFSLVY